MPGSSRTPAWPTGSPSSWGAWATAAGRSRPCAEHSGFSPGNVDFVFLDHAKEAYLPDLLRILEAGWLHPGSVVVADNVRFPGAPKYRRYMEEGWGSAGGRSCGTRRTRSTRGGCGMWCSSRNWPSRRTNTEGRRRVRLSNCQRRAGRAAQQTSRPTFVGLLVNQSAGRPSIWQPPLRSLRHSVSVFQRYLLELPLSRPRHRPPLVLAARPPLSEL